MKRQTQKQVELAHMKAVNTFGEHFQLNTMEHIEELRKTHKAVYSFIAGEWRLILDVRPLQGKVLVDIDGDLVWRRPFELRTAD